MLATTHYFQSSCKQCSARKGCLGIPGPTNHECICHYLNIKALENSNICNLVQMKYICIYNTCLFSLTANIELE